MTLSFSASVTGRIEDGVLHGDLYIVGDGDPFLVSERLWLLANQLRLAGIDAITGRLVFDDSAWPRIEDWSSFGGSDRAYAATPSALAMNFNAVAFHITPGSAEGDPVKVRQDPFDLPYLTIENRLRTGKSGSAVRWSLDLRTAALPPHGDHGSPDTSSSRPPLAEAAYPREIARLEGTVPAGHAPIVAYRRAREPLALAGSLLHGFLRSAGIDHHGGIAFGHAPLDAVTLLEFESLPLDDLVASMNRYSNNFIANQLALTVAREGSPLDWPNERIHSTTPAALSPNGCATRPEAPTRPISPMAAASRRGIERPRTHWSLCCDTPGTICASTGRSWPASPVQARMGRSTGA